MDQAHVFSFQDDAPVGDGQPVSVLAETFPVCGAQDDVALSVGHLRRFPFFPVGRQCLFHPDAGPAARRFPDEPLQDLGRLPFIGGGPVGSQADFSGETAVLDQAQLSFRRQDGQEQHQGEEDLLHSSESFRKDTKPAYDLQTNNVIRRFLNILAIQTPFNNVSVGSVSGYTLLFQTQFIYSCLRFSL